MLASLPPAEPTGKHAVSTVTSYRHCVQTLGAKAGAPRGPSLSSLGSEIQFTNSTLSSCLLTGIGAYNLRNPSSSRWQ